MKITERSKMFEVRIGLFCNANISHNGETFSHREMRHVQLFIKAFDAANVRRLANAKTMLDELAEEIWYMSGYGVYRATLKRYQDGKLVPILECNYSDYPSQARNLFFSIEFYSHDIRRIVIPYANIENQLFPGKKFSSEDIYPIDKINETALFHTHPLFQRFIRRFDNLSETKFYYYQDQAYHAYKGLDGICFNILPQNRQSVKHRKIGSSRAKIVKKILKREEKQAKQARKKAGKTPVSDKIYLIATPDHLYKIGVSKRPKSRLKALQTNHPHSLTLLHTFPAEHGKEAESKLHRFFHQSRLNGEWFALNDAQRQSIEEIEEYQNGKFLSKTQTPLFQALNIV